MKYRKDKESLRKSSERVAKSIRDWKAEQGLPIETEQELNELTEALYADGLRNNGLDT